ncbi:FCD domain-containing protein [Mesorhizobium sp. BR1-1-16]|uniref:FadR/GntR family transcriptional regulator n=1 Tax=Mesorhizobium sp. BR1-1-16 TaxID=2876653 RepID=UPI001CCAE8BF|nr:FCD domain-containing protein [Mesorhizobium sp. BR1-1-16]
MERDAPKDIALAALRRRLDMGEFANNRLPPERELAVMLGVSRRALREALDTLETEGLVWRRQGQGTFAGSQGALSEQEISRLSHRVNPLEAIEARLSIEPMLVRRCAMRASQAEIDVMVRLANSARTAKDARSYETFDIAFHRKIATCAGNALFLSIFEMIISVREKADWKHVREYYFDHGGAERSYIEHRAIIDAVIARNPAAAEAAMRQHLSQIASDVLGIDSLYFTVAR